MRLVEVYNAHSEGEARLVWGLLESHGIRCTLAGEAVSRGPNGDEEASPGDHIQLLVPANEVEKAQKVLELLRE